MFCYAMYSLFYHVCYVSLGSWNVYLVRLQPWVFWWKSEPAAWEHALLA